MSPKRSNYRRKKFRWKPELDLSIKLKPAVKKRFSRFSWIFKGALIVAAILIIGHFAQPFFSKIRPQKVEKTAAPAPKPVPSKAPEIPSVPKPVVVPVERPEPIPLPPLPEPEIDYARVARKARPLPADKPLIMIVIDDIGYNRRNEDLIRGLGREITYAILPNLPQSGYFGELSRKTGADVILHQPLEAQDGTIPGPGLITERMEPDHMRSVLDRNLRSVVRPLGVNNHMGSQGTQNHELMRTLLSELKKRNMFFLDSYTTPRSVAGSIARDLSVPFVQRGIFLDNEDDPEAIRRQLEKLAAEARAKGHAIGIGHDRTTTLRTLAEEIPLLKEAGFELVPLYDFVEHQKKYG
ncbi:MAG: divergent polysaccharide deacetylase family protein [Candidatus Omnitrophota bacterium]